VADAFVAARWAAAGHRNLPRYVKIAAARLLARALRRLKEGAHGRGEGTCPQVATDLRNHQWGYDLLDEEGRSNRRIAVFQGESRNQGLGSGVQFGTASPPWGLERSGRNCPWTLCSEREAAEALNRAWAEGSDSGFWMLLEQCRRVWQEESWRRWGGGGSCGREPAL